MSAGDEPVDVRKELEEKFHSQCSKEWKDYEQCGDRVKQLPTDSGKNCSGFFNQYWSCVDHLISKELFHHLK